MLKVPPDPVPRRVWTPAGRTSRQMRNSRVKVVGSLCILILLVVASLALLAFA